MTDLHQLKVGAVYTVKTKKNYKIDIPYLAFDLPILHLQLQPGARIVLQKIDYDKALAWFFVRAKGVTLLFGITKGVIDEYFELKKHRTAERNKA